MKRQTFLPTLLLSIGLAGVLPAGAAEPGTIRIAAADQRTDQPGSVPRATAVRELQAFVETELAHAASGLPQGFPLAIRDLQDLRGATVGTGYQVFDANSRELLAGSSLSDSAHASGRWRFVVQIDGRPAGLLTVALHEGTWQLVSIGGIEAARELEAVNAYHAATNGTPLRLIRVPQATADFLEVNSGGALRFAPLRAARETLARIQVQTGAALSAQSLLNDADFVPALRTAVTRNLAQ